MRISDWSSDVCSSDLVRGEHVVDRASLATLAQGHARAPPDNVLRQAGASVREVRYRMLAGREVTEVEMADGSVRLPDAETASVIPRVNAAMARAVAVRSYRGERSDEYTVEIQCVTRI